MKPSTIAAKVFAQVTAFPETHRQYDWVDDDDLRVEGPLSIAGQPKKVIECGAACCIAGWAVALAPRSQVLAAIDEVVAGGESDDNWGAVARQLLGITNREADWLFDGSQDEDVAKEAVLLLASGQSVSDHERYQAAYGDDA